MWKLNCLINCEFLSMFLPSPRLSWKIKKKYGFQLILADIVVGWSALRFVGRDTSGFCPSVKTGRRSSHNICSCISSSSIARLAFPICLAAQSWNLFHVTFLSLILLHLNFSFKHGLLCQWRKAFYKAWGNIFEKAYFVHLKLNGEYPSDSF